jgi:hypothetical protein
MPVGSGTVNDANVIDGTLLKIGDAVVLGVPTKTQANNG